MRCQRVILFSSYIYILFVNPFGVSGIWESFEDFELLPDMNLGQESLANDDDLYPFTQEFNDESDPIIGMYEEDPYQPLDPLSPAIYPLDLPPYFPGDNLDMFPPLEDESDFLFHLGQDPSCSADRSDQMVMRKRDAGKMCPMDSTTPSTPDQPFPRGSSIDPEFYGLPLLGYVLEQPGEDDENSPCPRDVTGRPQFLVCDSGNKKDWIFHYASNRVVLWAISLKNCFRRMYIFLFLKYISSYVCFFLIQSSFRKSYVSASNQHSSTTL